MQSPLLSQDLDDSGVAEVVAYAEALEAEAAGSPEQRGWLLLAAARVWLDAGRRERAVELLVGLVNGRPEQAPEARVELVHIALVESRRADVDILLGELARDPGLTGRVCEMAAEALCLHGATAQALDWYDRLVARVSPAELDEMRAAGGMSKQSPGLLRRRALRRDAGLPPEATDDMVSPQPHELPLDLDTMRDHLGRGGQAPDRIRMLTFQRVQRAEARRRWPDVYSDSDDDYYPAAERRSREFAARGVPSIMMVPGIVDDLVAFADRIGESPRETAVRARFVDQLPTSADIAWPPPRNAPCWCGSGTKYKRCCGAVR